MNAELSAKEPNLSLSDQELASALVATYGLTTQDMQRISQAMRNLNLGFSEAAVQLGCVTRQQVEHALSLGIDEKNQTQTDGDTQTPGQKHAEAAESLIETVVRRFSTSRALVVREGAAVKPGEKLLLPHEPYNTYSEQIRALRTELQLRCPPSGRAAIIAVLSARQGEGRSRLAAELAIAFAQLGGRTLLVDADFRHPTQHELFDSDNGEGLAQAITSGQSPYVHRVEGVPQMGLLTAGPVSANPLELLSDGRLSRCMIRWRDSYEIIIVDTPPVSRYADGLAVAAIAGRVVVLTRNKLTRYREAREMLRRLVNTQAQVLGAVLHNF
jgi:protein-tyrosine kinase